YLWLLFLLCSTVRHQELCLRTSAFFLLNIDDERVMVEGFRFEQMEEGGEMGVLLKGILEIEIAPFATRLQFLVKMAEIFINNLLFKDVVLFNTYLGTDHEPARLRSACAVAAATNQ
ncbi:hypothetical protein PMAYCL1PPCAC_00544, partial [Pristionchus mayeri]